MTPAALHALLDVEEEANRGAVDRRPTPTASPATDLMALAGLPM